MKGISLTKLMVPSNFKACDNTNIPTYNSWVKTKLMQSLICKIVLLLSKNTVRREGSMEGSLIKVTGAYAVLKRLLKFK